MSFEVLGQILKNARRTKSLTQRQLAELLQVDYTYISKIENGRIEGVSNTTLASLAKILKLNFKELLELKLGAKLQDLRLDNLQSTYIRRLEGENKYLSSVVERLEAENRRLELDNRQLKEALQKIELIAKGKLR